jgi:hypothetical protein
VRTSIAEVRLDMFCAMCGVTSTKCRHAAYPLITPGKKNSLTVIAPTTSAASCLRAEFYDLTSRSIASMAVSIFSNDLPARILASA